MGRATHAQKAKRLNQARSLLRRYSLPQAVRKLIHSGPISRRQAYRYLRQAQHLRQPVPITAPTIAFTVKLPRPLIVRLRRHAARLPLTLSETVRQALSAMLDRGRRRG